jgi:hypothetical protein
VLTKYLIIELILVVPLAFAAGLRSLMGWNHRNCVLWDRCGDFRGNAVSVARLAANQMLRHDKVHFSARVIFLMLVAA